MKTTVELADALLVEAKRLAAREKRTLREVLEEGLRLVLDDRGARQKQPFQMVTFGVGGLQPEVREGDWQQLRALIYEGQGG
ncbi:MAG: hypothetical protein ACJ790_21665 [Myxococcaceae bacterium]